MSDFSSGFGGFEESPTPKVMPVNKKGKVISGYQKPPYFLLFIGFVAAPISCLLLMVAPPTGSNTILVGIGFWLLSLVSYFAPFALFTLSDLAKQANLNYLANSRKSQRFRSLLLIEGSLLLIFPTYYLGSSLASWVSVLLG
jgi:hypothetical protein